jgi:hypothetical protein
MKSKLLLATALASLLASAGIAGAQGTNEQGHKGPGAAPSTQHAQSPSEHAQPGNRMGQSERSPSNSRMTNPSAQNEKNRTKNSSQNGTNRTQNSSAQNERNRMANPSAQNEQNERSRTQNPSAQNEKNKMQNPSAQSERNRMERNPSATENERGTAENRQGTSENRGASAQLSTEERSRIRTTVLGERNAPRVAQSDININLRVGARIPRDRLHIRPLPLPQTVVEVEPRWRGYDYFLVGNEIVVVEPNTFEIVAIIPA